MRILVLAALFAGECFRSTPDTPPEHSFLGVRGLEIVGDGCQIGVDRPGHGEECGAVGIESGIIDDERDPTRIEVEVIREGQTFSGTATHVGEFDDAGYNESAFRRSCTSITGLEANTLYRARFRITQPAGENQEWWECESARYRLRAP